MASFSVSLTEWAAGNRGSGHGEKGVASSYGNSSWTIWKTGRDRFVLGSTSAMSMRKARVRQPGHAGGRPVDLTVLQRV